MTAPAVARSDRRQLVQLVEVFGPTFQGEGPSAGQRAVFMRFADCNLTCPPCDTRYSWDWSSFDRSTQVSQVTPEDLVSDVLDRDAVLVIGTGGETLLQQPLLTEVAEDLAAAGRRVEIETNGTIIPTERLTAAVARFVVSPKLGAMGAGMPLARRIKPSVLAAFQATGKASFKFVLDGPADVEELRAFQEAHQLGEVWVMPQGTTEEAVLTGLRRLAEPALQYGWHLSSRLHVLVWGDERGR